MKKTLIAAEKENVVIRAGDCAVTLLPAFGGKISSICLKGRELLQTPLRHVLPRTRTMSFDNGDASGWDECLPSVAACRLETDTGPVDVPDHGDLWRTEWSVVGDHGPETNKGLGTGGQGLETSGAKNGGQWAVDGGRGNTSVTLRGECFSLPLTLERTLDLIETEKGWQLRLSYQVTNIGQVATPWSWAAHPLFASGAGDHIVLPKSIRAMRLEGSGGGRLGKSGDRVEWPVARLADRNGGDETDLSTVQPSNSRIGDKLFAGPLRAHENWCALERPAVGVCIRVKFDAAATPYLGLWICSGGWPERPGPKQMCVAMEPATAPVDSLGQMGGWSRVLGPGESCSWPLLVDVETI